MSGADQIGVPARSNCSLPALFASAVPPSLAGPAYLSGTLVKGELSTPPPFNANGCAEQVTPSSVEQMLAPPNKTLAWDGSLRNCSSAPRRKKSRSEDCRTSAAERDAANRTDVRPPSISNPPFIPIRYWPT